MLRADSKDQASKKEITLEHQRGGPTRIKSAQPA
jgi:hypothetical protein